jgi:hypothetical protein
MATSWARNQQFADLRPDLVDPLRVLVGRLVTDGPVVLVLEPADPLRRRYRGVEKSRRGLTDR